MSKLGTALAFLAGVAVGGVTAFTVLQKRYDDAVENDIFSIKEAFHKREQKLMNEIADLKEYRGSMKFRMTLLKRRRPRLLWRRVNIRKKAI